MQSTPTTTGMTPDSPSGTNSNTNLGNADSIGSEIRSDVDKLSTSASNRVHSELDSRKGAAAEQAKSVSSAFQRAAGELDDGAPQWLKSAFQQGAQHVRRFADTLEQKDSRAILNDIQAMARNNPGAFLAGCAAVGFAAARVLKAGASESSMGQSRQPQFPPRQVQEPMFRQSGSDSAPATKPAGEFA